MCYMNTLPSFIRLLFSVLLLVSSAQVLSGVRNMDPDGCLVCHEIEGLEYLGENSVLREASINSSHYYQSLHGSVPCTDCHRKIEYYPHKPENGDVDCGGFCHLNEPSKGENFTHQPIVDEFEKSSHGEGAFKGLSGSNRWQEDKESHLPSCRSCHDNAAYIEPGRIEQFNDAFEHTDTECGNCHAGEAWRDQFGGHLMRRLLGSRWAKNDANVMCIRCHEDQNKMAHVEFVDNETGKKEPASYRWKHVSESYDKSLHARLLKVGMDEGASCLDCHAPKGKGWRHGVAAKELPESSTHASQIAETCGQSGCHQYAKNAANSGFVSSDQHDIDHLEIESFSFLTRLKSSWVYGGAILATFSLLLLAGQLVCLILVWSQSDSEPLLGSQQFRVTMMGLKKRVAKNKRVRKE